jgi:hypothetical protein
MKNEKISIYLILPSDYLIEYARFLRLMLLIPISHFSRSKKGQHQVLIVLDEFANLGTLKTISNNYGLIAGYGVTLWTIIQNLDQMKENYPKNWSIFTSNSGVTTSFNLNDPETADFLKRRGGDFVQTEQLYGMPDFSDEFKPTPKKDIDKDIVFFWEDEFVELFRKERERFKKCNIPNPLFYFVQGRAEPLKGSLAHYDEHEPLKSRADENPYAKR